MFAKLKNVISGTDNSVPVEGLLPMTISAENDMPLITFSGEVVDSLRQLISRIYRSDDFDKIPERIAMVSSVREEGTTYMSRALGAVLAHDYDARVVIAELNWWHPSSTTITQRNIGGLAALVAGEATLDEVIVSTSNPNLFILPSGFLPKEERPITARSAALQLALDMLQRRFDYVLLDIPAVLATSDAAPLAQLGRECIIMVLKQGATPIGSVRLALDEISHLKIAGILLNQVNIRTPPALLNMIPQAI